MALILRVGADSNRRNQGCNLIHNHSDTYSFCGAGRIRTADLLVMSQLSYRCSTALCLKMCMSRLSSADNRLMALFFKLAMELLPIGYSLFNSATGILISFLHFLQYMYKNPSPLTPSALANHERLPLLAHSGQIIFSFMLQTYYIILIYAINSIILIELFYYICSIIRAAEPLDPKRDRWLSLFIPYAKCSDCSTKT